jgi:hypothetical protein
MPEGNSEGLGDGDKMIKTGIYRHYKGALYKVMGTAQHSESQEWLVHYQALYGEYGYWVRPLEMFCENVEVQGDIKKRFVIIKED